MNPYLVDIARKTLDKCGYKNTKIIVSSGLDVESIKNFIKVNSPIDAYGIGSSLITRNVHFSKSIAISISVKYCNDEYLISGDSKFV